MSLLRVRNLCKSYGGLRAVDGINFELHEGELLALIGPNGAGKSTTFDMVGGQRQASSGSIEFAGRNLVGMMPRDIWRLGVGRTFQIAATFSSFTVVENIQIAILSHRRRVFSFWKSVASQFREEALELLDQVGMRSYADRPCSQLAYGDVKRVELAMGLANAPKLLLMDEPTAGMAPKERNELMTLTKRLVVERRMAVLFTEHSMDVVFAHADRMIVLARGRLIAEGSAEKIRSDPKVQEVYFGSGKTFESNPRPEVLVVSVATNQETPGSSSETSSLLEVSGINAWYGAAHVLFDISLRVRRGEVVALMGRNGAGKTTTLKSIMGLLEKRRGQIQFLGQDISDKSPFEISRMGLGYVPEDRRIFSDLSVTENLEVGKQSARSWPDGTEALNWTPSALYALFPNLGAMQTRPGGQMSGGEQQMLTVARTLMGNPYLVLLDEPSEGVAPLIVEQMAHMILSLKAKGASILLSEQNLHFAELVSDRAYVLEKGQIKYEGTMRELAGNEDVRRTYLSV